MSHKRAEYCSTVSPYYYWTFTNIYFINLIVWKVSEMTYNSCIFTSRTPEKMTFVDITRVLEMFLWKIASNVGVSASHFSREKNTTRSLQKVQKVLVSVLVYVLQVSVCACVWAAISKNLHTLISLDRLILKRQLSCFVWLFRDEFNMFFVYCYNTLKPKWGIHPNILWHILKSS